MLIGEIRNSGPLYVALNGNNCNEKKRPDHITAGIRVYPIKAI